MTLPKRPGSWRNWILPPAKIFISYATIDRRPFAVELCGQLTENGFRVFLDADGILIGERFKDEIPRHLRESDAMLVLISEGYGRSDWCQAEFHVGHTMKLPVLPVRFAGETPVVLPEPLATLINEYQHVEVAEPITGTVIFEALRKRFLTLKARVRRRQLIRATWGLAMIAVLCTGLATGIAELRQEWYRRQLISRIQTADQMLPGTSLAADISRFQGDNRLRKQLLLLADDTTAPSHRRLNAMAITTATGEDRGRWFVKDLNWKNADYQGGSISNTTFFSGAITSAKFERVHFGGVLWGEASSFGISTAAYRDCTFAGGAFLATNVIDAEFTNCQFIGTNLDVQNFGHVRFRTQASEETSPHMVTGGVCSFENAVIFNCKETSAAGTLDFSGPENEVTFYDVVFESCRFRGLIRPSWFQKCSFFRCVFPESFKMDELKNAGNHVVGAVMANEGCP